MNCSLDQSICCIVQAQATISQSFATLISTSIVPHITKLTDPNIKTCLTNTLLTSNAQYVEANACLLKSVAYYHSVVNPPQMCQPLATPDTQAPCTVDPSISETCLPLQALPYGKTSTLSR